MIKFKESKIKTINKKFTNDCVIRSISIVLDETYKSVFHDLMKLGSALGGYPNCDFVWQPYIESKGMIRHKMPRPENKPRGTIKLKNWSFTGKAVVVNSGHLTAVVNGYCLDTWDCTYRPVNSYWTYDK
jgi:hypothetical protein|tara:strand:- start:630 stop:1016 length:387 start_codon:yes stop_codon:yes gene_type:complete